jgi:hypothetical protein
LFYHPSTFQYLLITLALSPDHICLNHPSTFHSLLITLVLSSDHICLYHPNTFHSLLIKPVSSPDDICLYHPSTFHSLLTKLVSSPDHIWSITWAPSIPSWSNFFHKCDQVIKQVCSRGNERCAGDKTNAIRWWNKFD